MGTTKQFCARGHDTAVTGRYSNGYCRACRRERGGRYVPRPKKNAAYCCNGHDYATFGKDAGGRCLECRRINMVAQHGPMVPIAPLQTYLETRELHIEGFPESDARKLHRWFSRGEAHMYSLDDFICATFEQHPSAIYGWEWFSYE